MRFFSALFAVSAALVPGVAQAQLRACAVPDRISVPRLEQAPRGEPSRNPRIASYLLAMSWSPEFCAGRNGARDALQCDGQVGRFGWVLHGLWPEAASRDYPQWCRPAKIVPERVIRENLCMTPSVQLIQHEWAKHGTCMSANPQDYFRTASRLFGAMRFPDMAQIAKNRQSAGSIRSAFAAVNPGTNDSMYGVSASREGALKEVRLCLNVRFKPQRCQPFQRGVADSRPITVRQPR